jgi:hypothetical protein
MQIDEARHDQRRGIGGAGLMVRWSAVHNRYAAGGPVELTPDPPVRGEDLALKDTGGTQLRVRCGCTSQRVAAWFIHPAIIAQKSQVADIWSRVDSSTPKNGRQRGLASLANRRHVLIQPSMREAGTRQRAHQWLSTLVGPYLGRGKRDFSFRLYEGEGITRTGEGMMFLSPAHGEVIGVGPDFIALRTGETRFDVITHKSLEQPLAIGQKVRLRYYDMRRFDGSRVSADLDQVDETQGPSAVADVLRVRFPITWPGRALPASMRLGAASMPVAQSRTLMTLVDTLESQMCDTLRNIPSLLVDAGARQVRVHEVPAEMLFGKPVPGSSLATISVSVRTRRFTGTVELGFDEVDGSFSVKLDSGAGPAASQTFGHLQPSDVAGLLMERVDDGRWRLVHTEPVEDPPPAAAMAPKRNPTHRQARWSSTGVQAQRRWMLILLLTAIGLAFFTTDGAGLFHLLGPRG